MKNLTALEKSALRWLKTKSGNPPQKRVLKNALTKQAKIQNEEPKQYKMYRDNEFWGFVWMTDSELAKIQPKATEQKIKYFLETEETEETEELEHLSSPNGCLEGCPACEAEK